MAMLTRTNCFMDLIFCIFLCKNEQDYSNLLNKNTTNMNGNALKFTNEYTLAPIVTMKGTYIKTIAGIMAIMDIFLNFFVIEPIMIVTRILSMRTIANRRAFRYRRACQSFCDQMNLARNIRMNSMARINPYDTLLSIGVILISSYLILLERAFYESEAQTAPKSSFFLDS